MLLVVLALLLSPIPPAEITGRVFIDQNKNGIFDPGEKGVAGVAVSDQQTVVVTDAGGIYRMQPASTATFVMISKPTGYKARAGYWKRLDAAQFDFPLEAVAETSTFSFIHASDTHISEKSEERTQKLKTVVDRLKPDFVLVTGDLVRDALRVPEEEARRYYELYVSNISRFQSPVWSVPGNHEIFGIERHLSLVSPSHPLYGKKMFHHYLGPNYYSFNFGGIHFVGLDDVDFEDTWYYGHVDSLQLNWLKEDLASVPANTPVVTFKHIPMFSGGLSMSTFTESGPGRTLEREKGQMQFRHVVSNAHELITVLTTHPYPVSLSGHYHARQTFRYESTGQNIRFEQTAAVVGDGGEGGIVMKSGVVVYKVTNGIIDAGQFVPID